jgi:hypothetical protein
MDASTPINQSGKVMVSIAGLRRLLANNYQAEMVEEMLNDVIADRLGGSGYRLAGIAANCEKIKWIEYRKKPNWANNEEDFPVCNGTVYLDREHRCDECGQSVTANQAALWIKKGIDAGTIVKSYTNMDTVQFWFGIWEEFERIENADAGKLARMVGK